MNQSLKKLNWIFAGISFLITMIVYSLTVSTTVSYWDCGEFIAAAFSLGVPHPPGAPLYLLLGRVASMVASDVTKVAYMTNYLSVLCSAFAILFMHLSIIKLFNEFKGKAADTQEFIFRSIAALIGCLTLTFSHSFWFSAVETEMYAGHMLFTSLMVYVTMLWAEHHEEDGSERYLLMVAYLVGLSTGLHILTLLTIPFTALIYYRKRVVEKSNFKFLVYLFIGFVLSIAVYPGVVKYLPKIIAYLGSMAWGGIILAGLIGLSYYLYVSNQDKIVRLLVASLMLVSIGYSTYYVIYVRSGLNPIVDENNPENMQSFMSYIGREQYGDMSLFPRRWSVKNDNTGRVWIGNGQAILHRFSPENTQSIENYEQLGQDAEPFGHFGAQIAYFWNYQIDHMLLRYIGWNFIGVPDGETQDLPSDWSKLYGIPLIMILVGFFYLLARDKDLSYILLVIWLIHGVALQFYLNQNEPQPRERDYTSVTVFYIMTIWLSFGVYFIFEYIRESLKKQSLNYIVALIIFLAIPANMMAKNYRSHDRSGNNVARDYSYNLLMSCEPNAILFNNGDNDTFPIWYLQVVEGVRTDVTAVNLSLINTPWYINQHKSGQIGTAAPITMSESEISKISVMPWEKRSLDLKVPKDIFQKESIEAMAMTNQGFNLNSEQEPTINFELAPQMQYPTADGNRGLLRVQDIMSLHMIIENGWKRPINFAVTVGGSNMLGGLRDYMRMDGLVFKLTTQKNWPMDPKTTENLLLNVYKYENLNDSTVFYNDNIQGLLQNLRQSFLQLAQYYGQIGKMDDQKRIVREMNARISPVAIPISNPTIKTMIDFMENYSGKTVFTPADFAKKSDSELEYMWQAAHQLRGNEKLRNAALIESINRLALSVQKRIQLVLFLLDANKADKVFLDSYRLKYLEEYKGNLEFINEINKIK